MHVVSQTTKELTSVITAGLADGEAAPEIGRTVCNGTGVVFALAPIQIRAEHPLARRVRDGLVTLTIDPLAPAPAPVAPAAPEGV